MSNSDLLIKLIQDLRANSQDDSDPSNTVLNIFHSPYEEMEYWEKVNLTKWNGSPIWAGEGFESTFNWNQGGSYAQSMEVITCLMLI